MSDNYEMVRSLRLAAVAEAELSLKDSKTTAEKHYARLALQRAQLAAEAFKDE